MVTKVAVVLDAVKWKVVQLVVALALLWMLNVAWDLWSTVPVTKAYVSSQLSGSGTLSSSRAIQVFVPYLWRVPLVVVAVYVAFKGLVAAYNAARKAGEEVS